MKTWLLQKVRFQRLIIILDALMVEVTGGNNEEVGKRKKKNLLDLHTNSNLPYFIVNKERFDQNKIEKIPKPQVDIYSKK